MTLASQAPRRTPIFSSITQPRPLPELSPKIMNWEQFFSMGGYAFYVWTSYGVAMTVLLLNLLAPLRRSREARKNIERMIRQERSKP